MPLLISAFEVRSILEEGFIFSFKTHKWKIKFLDYSHHFPLPFVGNHVEEVAEGWEFGAMILILNLLLTGEDFRATFLSLLGALYLHF